MKLLLDQGLPRSAAARLRAGGVDVVHTGDCGLAGASDVEVLAAALKEGRTVVTLDTDFHAILALSGAAGPSVVRLRIEGLRGEALSGLVATVLSRCADDLAAGALVSVTEDQIRVRRLPIRPARA
jgi:predicted nuclease of predicted toxin-antitoxin system